MADNVDACGFEVLRERIAAVVGGEDGGRPARGDAVTVEIGAHRAAIINARPIVAAEDERALFGTCRKQAFPATIRHSLSTGRWLAGSRTCFCTRSNRAEDVAVIPAEGGRPHQDRTFRIDPQFVACVAGEISRRPAADRAVSDRSEPPGSEPSSTRMTRAPARPAVSAAASPVGPAPMTSRSQCASSSHRRRDPLRS